MIKSYFYTSILFPLMLVVMIAIRKSLDCVFTHRELKILDDIMPEMTKRAAVEDLHHLDEVKMMEFSMKYEMEHFNALQDQPPEYPGNIDVTINNGNIMILPIKPINITEEVNKTTIWKQVNESNNGALSPNDSKTSNIKKKILKSSQKISKYVIDGERHRE